MSKHFQRRGHIGREKWLLLYLPIYLLLFFITERWTAGSYWVSYCPLDDAIPFVRQFVVFYVLWYPLMLGMMLYLLFHDRRAFLRYGWAVIIGFTASIACFFLLPSEQNLRPAELNGNDVFSLMLRAIYAADTNTNVFPSMHIVGTLAAMVAGFDTGSIGWRGRTGVVILGMLINASTVLVKQHSILDVLGGIALYAVVFCVVYLRRRRPPDDVKA